MKTGKNQMQHNLSEAGDMKPLIIKIICFQQHEEHALPNSFTSEWILAEKYSEL